MGSRSISQGPASTILARADLERGASTLLQTFPGGPTKVLTGFVALQRAFWHGPRDFGHSGAFR